MVLAGASVRLIDPVTKHLSLEKALLNIGNDASLGNVDAVNSRLQANPGFLERIDALVH
jgi:hypothetical protein